MDIKLAQTPDEVLEIMKLKEDDIEDYIEGSKSEFIQWIISSYRVPFDQRKIFTWVVFEDKELKAYMIMMDGRLYPLTNCLFILYVYSKLGPKKSKEAFDFIADWARRGKVESFVAATRIPSVLEKYGFTKKDITTMILEL